jgi:hypothetical protein
MRTCNIDVLGRVSQIILVPGNSVMGNLDISRVSSEPSESKATCALG